MTHGSGPAYGAAPPPAATPPHRMSARALPWLALALGLVLACAGFGWAALATPAGSVPPTVVAPAPPPESAPSPVAAALDEHLPAPDPEGRIPAGVYAPGPPRVVLVS